MYIDSNYRVPIVTVHAETLSLLSSPEDVAINHSSVFQWKFHMALAWCRDAGIYFKMFSDVIRDIRRIPVQEDRADAPLTIDQLLPCFFLFTGKHCTSLQKL